MNLRPVAGSLCLLVWSLVEATRLVQRSCPYCYEPVPEGESPAHLLLCPQRPGRRNGA